MIKETTVYTDIFEDARNRVASSGILHVRLFQNFSFGTATLKSVVSQG
jgi:hypothetical protein